MKKTTFFVLLPVLVLFALPAPSAGLAVTMNRITDQGKAEELGTVTLSETQYGLLLTPLLNGLKPGMHGFHIHEKPACGPGIKDGAVKAGIAAGGHYDPDNTGKHEGPYGKGHLGDLPVLMVDEQGKATTPVLAPRLKLTDIKGRALMVHQGGDNYTDKPELGGGGAREACGIIPH